MIELKPCILIPTYDNPDTIARVVDEALGYVPDVVVVDDGSGPRARGAIDGLARRPGVHVHRRARNGGKGAAVKDGLRVALDLGYTHAVQVDADGQHKLGDIPRFLETAQRSPTALVLGQPVFDETVPASRLRGRRISIFWAAVETLGPAVGDPLCGFRVYPIRAALAARARGNRMDFDPEIVVRMAWQGIPIEKLPTEVRYISREEGGVSHFQMFRDNVRISWAHTRLVCGAILRLMLGRKLSLPARTGRGGAQP